MYAAFMTELSQFMINTGIATVDTIRGCSDKEIREIEQQLSIQVPVAMAECFLQMGKECGQLMDHDAFGIRALMDARNVAIGITTEEDSPWRLPDNVIPFLQHHGYEFLFLYSHTGDDPPVWLYIETDSEPKEWAMSFTGWLRECAIDVIERNPWNDEICREIAHHRSNWMPRKVILDTYEREAMQIRKSLIARLIQTDHARGCITGPMEMQQIWNLEFRNTDLFRKLESEGKRIPWGWVNPSEAKTSNETKAQSERMI